eukprot:CAMPEP_0182417354 /NCGR_PEP_ID=MMETSP1167-20130531/1801_1 /TAXON_ID=2988 /ORGANISM="Mallomonas Sp, Strain CCMP3275" /LENGTH=234 /DNA_ID=CAMNT_0024590839 /DNA_START=181 /DNA_END=885 /DNA_ORIENTATION=-
MYTTYNSLCQHLIGKVESLSGNKKYWVGVGGGPGAGKSTLSAAICSKINEILNEYVAVVLPMDGFHYSRKQLREISEKSAGELSFESLLARRGAPWTFDAHSLCTSLIQARKNGTGSFPLYSREVSDPIPNGVQLLASHRIVLVEGNYLLNWDDDNWSPLSSVFDETWFIAMSSIKLQRERLIKRHLETWNDEKSRLFGVGEIGASARADSNDVLNAEFVESHKKYANRVIISL